MVVIGQNALAALGLSLMIGTAGEVVLAQAAFFGLGAYAAAAASRHGVDPWLAIGVAALVGAAVAAVVGWPTLRLRGHYLTLATLGLGVIAKVVFDEAGGLTGGPSGSGISARCTSARSRCTATCRRTSSLGSRSASARRR